MEENKVKVDTRISESDYEKVLKIAADKYDGNKSLSLRMVIKAGISSITDPSRCKHQLDDFKFRDNIGYSAECIYCSHVVKVGP